MIADIPRLQISIHTCTFTARTHARLRSRPSPRWSLREAGGVVQLTTSGAAQRACSPPVGDLKIQSNSDILDGAAMK